MPIDTSAWMWWFATAVVLAFALNIASSYAKTLIDRQWGKWSDSRRIKNQKELEEVQQRASKYNTDSIFRDNTELSRLMAIMIAAMILLILILFVMLAGLSSFNFLNSVFFVGLAVFFFMCTQLVDDLDKVRREAKRMRKSENARIHATDVSDNNSPK